MLGCIEAKESQAVRKFPSGFRLWIVFGFRKAAEGGALI